MEQDRGRFGHTTRPLLSIVVPTIPGRTQELQQALESIVRVPFEEQPEIIVSGNGCGEETLILARAYGVLYFPHEQPMSASVHMRLLPSLSTGIYLWIVGDDDLVNQAGALAAVRYLSLGRDAPICVIGRARTFVDISAAGQGRAQPVFWWRGRYTTIEEVASATSGVISHGAYIVQRDRLSIADYDHFLGTSHEMFGQLWRAVERNASSGVVVLDDVLIELRMAQKAWDRSYLETAAGVNLLWRKLPASVRFELTKQRHSLPVREMAKVAWQYSPRDTKHLLKFSRNYVGFLARLSPLLVPLLSPVAKALKWTTSRRTPPRPQ